MFKYLAGAALAFGLAGAAHAALPIYATPGFENAVTYSFTAAGDGDLLAYFTGSNASFTEVLGVEINGVDSGITGLNNHTSAYGDSLNFGFVHAGDSLNFYINVFNTGDTFYTVRARNNDGVNHVFSASYAGDPDVPAGVYVAFEDLPNGGDFNYRDETFVFTNVTSTPGGVPEPASWALMIIGFGTAGAMLRRKSALA